MQPLLGDMDLMSAPSPSEEATLYNDYPLSPITTNFFKFSCALLPTVIPAEPVECLYPPLPRKGWEGNGTLLLVIQPLYTACVCNPALIVHDLKEGLECVV